jgi:anti-sigma B factor antagonist
MADQLFRIFQEQNVSVVEFQLRPEVDVLLLDRVLEGLAAELATHPGGGAWVLDLTQVSYLNSAGLGMLVNIRFKVRAAGGKLALCGLSVKLMELFKSCCLERLFVIAKTRSEAIAVLR